MSNFALLLLISAIKLMVCKETFGETRNILAASITRTFDLGDNTRPDIHNDNKVNFRLFTKSNPTKFYLLKSDEDVIRSSYFSVDNPTKVIIHGWSGSASDEWMSQFAAKYLSVQSVNVILVDWTAAQDANYFASADATKEVGKLLKDLLVSLQQVTGLQFSQVHLVGFSLGAHVAGVTGYHLSGMIGRITGLDPAGPGTFGLSELFFESPADTLDRTDAQFVDIIHTNAGYLGILQPFGHADFFPDGGTYQSGCGLNFSCCHGRAHELMLESITNLLAFPAYKCNNFLEIRLNKCESISSAYMGEYNNAYGIYYVKTNYNKPFEIFHTI